MQVDTCIRGIARHFASYDLFRTQNGCFIKQLLVHIIIIELNMRAYEKALSNS